uniref:Serine carboxypeptidase II-3 n=1 Tax=Anthurium amnicola TaxID=1678845 RepID=A0A1D1Z1S0_9ARAE
MVKHSSEMSMLGTTIGNAYLDGYVTRVNVKAKYDYLWTHALISDETHAAFVSNCKFLDRNLTADCEIAAERAYKEVGNIDHYNIYAPTCHGTLQGKRHSTDTVVDFDPCSDSYVKAYLNLPEVKKALHANMMLPYPWSFCSKVVGGLNWKDMPDSILPIIRQLMNKGLKIWLYSGDTDSVVSVTSTRNSIGILSLPIEMPWRPWISEGEVGGYVVGYKGLVFVTVRGAGHLVPSYQPRRALTMFTAFLQGKLPPSS